eukprot:TRINITY_DN57546_c0_g1_i1.p1 TRINITY_DN57546_c0_g1~~TRINITY_DN57546_c0_g1_i1.p1  ORF type:complete len:453 (-),score=36.39 TRINITY_DN57546_c0_g1_i1:94-1452(-)
MAPRLSGFPSASLKSARLDDSTLESFRASLRRETSELASLAGAAHVILHRGKCVFSCEDGWANIESGKRFRLNTLCRLHGATKPLIAAAFLALVDAGKCRLSDPISKYLQFPDYISLGKASRGGQRSRAASKSGKTPIKKDEHNSKSKRVCATLRDLLTMTAGLGYEDTSSYKGVMKSVRSGAISDLTGLCDALLQQPLQAPPGTRYEYSFCHDMLGRVCEVISGLPLEKFMKKYLLQPLGMKDTHFVVPAHKMDRAAELYECKKVGRRVRGNTPYMLKPYEAKGGSAPGILSCGGGVLSYEDAGMWSTAADYARFCAMLSDGGRAPGSGCQILRPATARALWQDALAELGGRDGRLAGWHDSDGPAKGGWWDYRGLSLLHSFLDLDEAPRPPSKKPRRSSSMWFSGGGGAFWTIDRGTGLVTVSFVQTFGGREDESDGFGPLAYRLAPCLE